jgi:hypothetical protein
METMEDILGNLDPTFHKGLKEKLSEKEITEVLATLLFEANKTSPDKLVEVRDYEAIKSKGTFKYAGQSDTLFKEGLMPEDVYKGLKDIGLDRHIGPSYLRVKGLLTHQPTRTFFGKQMAFVIRDYLRDNPVHNLNGFVVCIPNMTGGVWIGDETRRQLENVLAKYKVWPSTPYVRETRKPIDAISPGEKFVDYVEGLMPSSKDTSVIFCFEELRTTAETSQNATKVYRRFGYGEESGVRIVEACVFDYGHQAGVERLKRLGVDRLFLVEGKGFFDVSKKLGYISDSQYRTAIDWLSSPWEFTRKVLPYVKKLAG